MTNKCKHLLATQTNITPRPRVPWSCYLKRSEAGMCDVLGKFVLEYWRHSLDSPQWASLKKKKSWVYYMWIMETQGAKGTYNHKLVSKWLGGYIFTLFSVLLLNFSSLRPRGCMRKIDSLPISVAASTDSLDAPRCSRQITQRRLIVWWRTAFTCCICFHGISCAAANAEWKMLTLDEWRQSPGPAARESPTPAPGGGGRLWYTKEQFTSHMRQSRPSHSGASPLRSTWSYH